MTQRPDVAYYYPAPYWGLREGGWIKSLLLFFDQIAILLPDYMYGRHEDADPTLVIPLEERGLLQVLDPNDWVDEKMTNQLAEIVVELLTNGVFDDLPHTDHFHELSQSRMGYGADVGLADMLVEELQDKGLARPSEDGVSVPLHPTVRTTILVTLGQLARAAGAERDLIIHPATNDPNAISDLVATLSREPMPSADKVVTLDLEPVTFDMDPIPLDDLLEFRAEHHNAHKAYMRDLQRFMAEIAAVDEPADREQLLLERRQEIADAAHDLQRSTRRTLATNLASWSLGLAGATWGFANNDPLGAVLTAAGVAIPQAISATLGGDSTHVAAYSYVFAAQRDLGMRYR